MIYDILEFDSSNIKILNDIETISGIFKVNGIDKFEETSNFIKLTSNNISDRITNLNADYIADGTENKYIINNIYSYDLTVSGDFTINDANKNTTIKSVLYSSNYVEIINHSENTAFTIKQYNDINDVFSVLSATEELLKITSNGNVGIGTNPIRKLDVHGDINFTGKLYNGESEFINSYMLKDGNDISFSSNIIINGDLTTEKLELNNTDGHSDIFIASNTSKEVFSIINNGNVGIGTNPIRKLDVDGDINFTGKLYNGQSEFINSYMFKIGNDISFSSNIIIKGDLTTEKLELNNTDGLSDIFIASNTSKEVFSIINNGNVGIGTNPIRKLDVHGDINFTGKLYNGESEFITSYMLKDGNDISFSSNIIINGDLTTNKLELNNTDGDSNIFTASNASKVVFSIINNGNVGIGITNPDYSLHVDGNDGILIPAGETSERPIGAILKKGVIRYNTENDQFEGYGPGDSWGSLGGVKDVNGDTYISAENNPGDNNDELEFFTSNFERMVINKFGKVGIGTTIPEAILHVVGDIIATNKITSHFSDERLKTDIELIPDPLNIIEQLNGFYYKPNKLANSFGIESNHRELGLSAQEVNKVLPELVDLAPLDIMHDENNNIVSKSGENYLTVSYDKMIPVIIESIKKLNSEIKLLKEENKLLKESIKKNS